MTATTHRVILGDARRMRELRDSSVHLIITSPPYWQLKDYGHPDQVGFSDTYEEYVNHLNLVLSECSRSLHAGCRLCVNIGDQFARSAYYGRYKVIPIRTEVIRFCETVGLDYMGAIIWQKVTTTNTTGGGAVMGSFPHPRNGILKLDYEFILVFRKRGVPPAVSAERKSASRMSTDEWNAFFAGHWNFPGERQRGHLAQFPEELPRRLIRMFSFVGDTVLDPFLGSGTTSLAARRLERNSLGYEINPDFLPLIRDKLGGKGVLVEKAARPSAADLAAALGALPYRFVDPVPVDGDVATSPRRHYGSRIDGSETARFDLHRVAAVDSPDAVVLDSGERVHLLGVRTLKRTRLRAVECLREMVLGKKVYLRYDDAQGVGKGSAPAYLYLRNRTPVNRHLIRSGLVAVDRTRDYRFKKVFLEESCKARKSRAAPMKRGTR